jgi:4-oxalocrotonate tautomerase
MPLITVEGPAIAVEKKRELVRGLTEVAARVYGIPQIIVTIRENPPENVAINGTLVADRGRT